MRSCHIINIDFNLQRELATRSYRGSRRCSTHTPRSVLQVATSFCFLLSNEAQACSWGGGGGGGGEREREEGEVVGASTKEQVPIILRFVDAQQLL